DSLGLAAVRQLRLERQQLNYPAVQVVVASSNLRPPILYPLIEKSPQSFSKEDYIRFNRVFHELAWLTSCNFHGRLHLLRQVGKRRESCDTFDRRNHCCTLRVSQHHYQRSTKFLDYKLDAVQGKIGENIARISDHKQIAQTLVEDNLRSCAGVG